MKEKIISLEEDFSNNEYYGTNVWTEEKYRTLSGNIPVLISAPHSVNQLRNDERYPILITYKEYIELLSKDIIDIMLKYKNFRLASEICEYLGYRTD